MDGDCDSIAYAVARPTIPPPTTATSALSPVPPISPSYAPTERLVASIAVGRASIHSRRSRQRAARQGSTSGFWSSQRACTFAELLIDCEEDRTVRAVLVGMLREGDRKPWLATRFPPVVTTAAPPGSVPIGHRPRR